MDQANFASAANAVVVIVAVGNMDPAVQVGGDDVRAAAVYRACRKQPWNSSWSLLENGIVEGNVSQQAVPIKTGRFSGSIRT